MSRRVVRPVLAASVPAPLPSSEEDVPRSKVEGAAELGTEDVATVASKFEAAGSRRVSRGLDVDTAAASIAKGFCLNG